MRIALYLMVVDPDTDPEKVARRVYEDAVKPFVDEGYNGRVLAVPVGEFHDMPPAFEVGEEVDVFDAAGNFAATGTVTEIYADDLEYDVDTDTHGPLERISETRLDVRRTTNG